MISLDSKESALHSLDKHYNAIVTHVLLNRTEAVQANGIKVDAIANVNIEVTKKLVDLTSLRNRGLTLIESIFDKKTAPHMVVNDSNKLVVITEAMSSIVSNELSKNKVS